MLQVLFPRVGLPLITGYLFVGCVSSAFEPTSVTPTPCLPLSHSALAGPYVLELIHIQDLAPLSLVTQFALAFIAFSAGAELYLPELRSLFKRCVVWRVQAVPAPVTFRPSLFFVALSTRLPRSR